METVCPVLPVADHIMESLAGVQICLAMLGGRSRRADVGNNVGLMSKHQWIQRRFFMPSPLT